MTSTSEIRVEGFSHVGVSTHDMAATLHFYCDVLNCPLLADELFDVGGGGFVRQVSIGLGNAQYIVFMHAQGIPSISAEYDTSINKALGVPGGMYHYALRVSNVLALEAAAAVLSTHGVDVSEVTDLGTIKSIFFVDPNGLQLELSATVRDYNITDIGRTTKATVASG